MPVGAPAGLAPLVGHVNHHDRGGGGGTLALQDRRGTAAATKEYARINCHQTSEARKAGQRWLCQS